MTATLRRELIARTLLQPSPTNPRKRFLPGPLAELRENIAAQGILQDLVVRPIAARDGADGQPLYEIVAGERRWRATEGLLDALPCDVRDMTDQQVIEAQLSENGPREPLHPLEEAEAYLQLLRDVPAWLPPRQPSRVAAVASEGGYSLDELAHRMGKSPAHVRARLRLLALTPTARAAFYDEAFGTASALHIARLNTQHQEELVQALLHDAAKGAPWSAHTVSHTVQQRYMLRLAGAPFSLQDEQLLPEAGSCTACPKRTGANPELFDDVVDGDTCADRACFERKCATHEANAIARAEQAGHAVITGKEAERLLPRPDATVPGYLRLDRPSDMALSNKPLAEVLGDGASNVALIVRRYPEGTPSTLVEVMPTIAVRQALKDKGLLKPEPEKPAKAASSSKSATPAKKPATGAAVALHLAKAEKASEQPDGELPLAPEVQKLVDDVEVIPSYRFKSKGNTLQKAELERWQTSAIETTRMTLAAGAVSATVASDGAEGLPSEGLNRLLLDCALCSGSMPAGDIAALVGLPAPAGKGFGHSGEWAWSLTEEQAARALLVALAASEPFQADKHPERDPATVVATVLGIDIEPLRARAERIVAAKLAKQLAKLQPPAAKPAAKKSKAAAPAKKPAAKKTPAYKYRDPATGDTWSGKGLQPKWLKVALANGRKLSDFDVANAAATPAKPVLSPAAAWPFPTGSGKATPMAIARAREIIAAMRAKTRSSVPLAVNEETLVKGMRVDRSVASLILTQLEQDKVVGPKDGDGLRDVLVTEATA
jgi:ParB-like chromosome segregation protein Spo0J/DNA-binding protein H-NS